MQRCLKKEILKYEGPKEWREINTIDSDIYNWEQILHIQSFFDNLPDKPQVLKDARILCSWRYCNY